MPTLQFKGKTLIWNHHLSIPYHTLEDVPDLNFQPEKGDGNLIIEGDNLLALKALLPQYAARIKCIYIDPPYNTGNDHWVYSDNVNSPMIKEWLGKEVGRDDLTRHDKWLCMMTPRLRLLRELLSDDGVILISIDDNEVHHLRMTMDEIFGEENFLGKFVWKTRNTDNRIKTNLSVDHEYVLTYTKLQGALYGRVIDRSDFQNPDNDARGPYVTDPLTGKATRSERPNLHYEIVNKRTGDVFSPDPSRGWITDSSGFDELLKDKRIWWPADPQTGKPRKKRFLSETSERMPVSSFWADLKAQSGADEVDQIMGDRVFAFPKALHFIRRILDVATGPDSIILDSFAGSGTTMHAVMDLNKEDGGARKCISVQMTESSPENPKKNICKSITRERIKRTIAKNGYACGFRYLRVGPAIDAERLLGGDLPSYKEFAQYVFFLCTGEHLAPNLIREKDYFVAEYGRSVIYLIYRQNFAELTQLALNLSAAEKMGAAHPDKNLIVYAPACFLDEEFLTARRIQFVNIPYGLFQKNGRV